jgi:hypothetical protein
MAKKIGDEASEELVSVTWKRPGTLDVLVCKVGQATGSVDYSKVFLGLINPKLIESYTENKSGILYRYSKYRIGFPFASPTAFNSDDEKESWSADVILNQRKITLHPKFKSILEAGWGVVVNDEVIWPRMIYKKKEAKGGAEFKGGKAKGDEEEDEEKEEPVQNPFFGLKTYFAPALRVTRERFSDQSGISAELLDGMAQFDDSDAARRIPFADVRAVKSGVSVSSSRSDKVVKTTWLFDPNIPEPVYEEKVK